VGDSGNRVVLHQAGAGGCDVYGDVHRVCHLAQPCWYWGRAEAQPLEKEASNIFAEGGDGD
jgi:hypothetical protein